MIDRDIKQCLGQMMKGVQVIGAASGGLQRAYTSHWLTQVAFEAPIVMASVSPKHDTYPLMLEAGEFAASLLAADQIVEGQYFSYPGRKFEYVAGEYLEEWPERAGGPPIVPNSIAWLRCEIFRQMTMEDHELLFARVVDVIPGTAEGSAAALLEPARLAGHRRQGPRAWRQHPRSTPRTGRCVTRLNVTLGTGRGEATIVVDHDRDRHDRTDRRRTACGRSRRRPARHVPTRVDGPDDVPRRAIRPGARLGALPGGARRPRSEPEAAEVGQRTDLRRRRAERDVSKPDRARHVRSDRRGVGERRAEVAVPATAVHRRGDLVPAVLGAGLGFRLRRAVVDRRARR